MNRKITDNNQKQAYLPKGSIPIENPVGTAPSFILNKNHKIITSLPGVPYELEYLLVHKILPYFSEQFTQASFIKKSVLHVSGMGESQIDELIGDLEMQANPTVGLAAHSGQIDIRVTAKADSAHLADQMLNKTATIIRNRLGDNIYGVDEIRMWFKRN
jgi:molybdopterin-biosynthesis enzyme MoeA-like protein